MRDHSLVYRNFTIGYVNRLNNSILHNPILFTTAQSHLQHRQDLQPSSTTTARKNTNNDLNPLVASATAGNNTITASITTAALISQSTENTNTTITVRSDYQKLDILASKASKRYCDVKKKFYKNEKEIKQLKKSLNYQRNLLNQVNREIREFLSTQAAIATATATMSISNSSGDTSAQIRDQKTSKEKSDSLVLMKNEANRAITHLTRRIDDVVSIHENQTAMELKMAHSISKTLWNELLSVKKSYIDPYDCCTHGTDFTCDHSIRGKKRNSTLSYLASRSYGVSSQIGKRKRTGVNRRSVGMRPTSKAICQRFEALLTKRLSHFVTVNSHLYCPVYCLRFDRTGQYFVTGADDNLVKLFRVGFPHYEGKRQYNANKFTDLDKRRGAVLVCTLRGHASVITDIDISSDNTLVATASDDGDVRVWGLADGCPVAILRGHTGGANMVR